MKLYEVPRNTLIRIKGTNDVLLFDHIDGMYSVCIYDDQVVHLSANTEVDIVEKEW
jgi:hypothetical protein